MTNRATTRSDEAKENNPHPTMNGIKWHFNEMTRRDMNQDIELGEMFGEEAINEPLSVRLVREFIQNSLDASIAKKIKGGERTKNDPVRIRFSLEGLSKPLPASKAALYFSGLQDHLVSIEGLDESVRDKAQKRELLDHDVPFIVIEDSGTTGLRGDPAIDDPDELDPTAESNDFCWFFRNIGRSGKGATENGSWGLGKWVLPDASGASTFLAITTTDQDTLLMGQSALKQHRVNGTKFGPHGYWAEIEPDDFAMPLRISDREHRPIVEGFISDFRLTQRDEPGLSIVIPFPWVTNDNQNSSYNIDAKELIKATIHNYFYPIVLGYLEVWIGGKTGEIPANITAATIRDMLNVIDTTGGGQWTAQSYRRLFQMLDDTMKLTKEDHIDLTEPPMIKDEYVHAEQLKDLRTRYENGELLPFNIRTRVQPKKEKAVSTEFNVYLRQHSDLQIGHDYFVRGTLSIPRIDRIKDHKALALVVVNEDEVLAHMLRDSEPPAHTEWRPRAKRVHNRWFRPQNRISEVMNSVRNILFFLENQPSGLQKNAFLDLFALAGPEAAATSGGKSRKGGGTKGPKEPIKPGKPSPFTVAATKGGISISASNAVDEFPQRIVIRAAYDVPRGNPFAKFNENDFAFRHDNSHGGNLLRVNMTGCEIVNENNGTPIGANAVRLNVKDRDNFNCKITGFDEFRDVVVRIDPEENS